MSRQQKEICPASYFAGLDGEKIHYTTRQEIQNNGGVCAKCKAKFEKRHKKSILTGNSFEENVAESKEVIKNIHRHWDTEGNNADISVKGSFYELDLSEIDGQEERDAAKDLASKAILKFALRLLERGSTPKRLFVTINAICFAAHIHPQQEQTQRKFSEQLGVTLSTFSLEVNHWRDLFNLPAIGGAKAKDKREKSIQAARLAHERKGHKTNSISDSLFHHINLATEQINKNHDRIKCMTPQRRQELVDRLKPFATLKANQEEILNGQQFMKV